MANTLTQERTLNAGTSPTSATTTKTAACGGFSKYSAITIVATLAGGTGGTLDELVALHEGLRVLPSALTVDETNDD